MKYTLSCKDCGGKIVTRPFWHWEKQEEKIAELQPFFCHKIDSTLVKQIPVLTENDWIAKQKADEFMHEFFDENGQRKPREAYQHLLVVDKGLPQIFLKHGIFPLIQFFSETELKALYLILCLEPDQYFKQTFLLKTMQISRPYVSAILKKFNGWKFLIRGRPRVKGRAQGRQIAYALTDETRIRLDKDLAEFEFFRNVVRTTVRPIALCFSEPRWRKDLGLLERENEQYSTARLSGLG
jgi:DNA-binding MarR family transcriptional regulator